jgi:hypothetical protein
MEWVYHSGVAGGAYCCCTSSTHRGRCVTTRAASPPPASASPSHTHAHAPTCTIARAHPHTIARAGTLVHTLAQTHAHARTHARAYSQLCTVHMHSAPADAASSACRHGKLSSMGYRHRRALLLRRAVQPGAKPKPQRCAALISEIVLRTGTPVVAIDYRRPPVLTGYSVLTAYSQGTRCLRVYWYVLAVIRDRTARADRCRSIHSRRRRQTASLRINCAQRRCSIAAARRVPLAIISWECRRRPCEAPMPRGPTMMRGIPG